MSHTTATDRIIRRTNMKKLFLLLVLTSLCVAALLAVIVHAQGQSQEQSDKAEVQQAIHHDVSPPLRDVPNPPRSDVPRERPLRLIPHAAHDLQDPVVQTTAGPLVTTTPGPPTPR